MKKSQPPKAELTLADTIDSTSKAPCIFTGTGNPRQLRVIHALLIRPRKREEIDRIAGASNGPEVIASLRRRGLAVPCDNVPGIDRDGLPINPGVYSLSDDDRRIIKIWQRKQNGGGL